ncbi:MAG TPA: glycyl-radical enzyme activating protein [Phycisphaerae bacterium]|nr:glycyl-radical enzyme activating protein [Phycisphaerae bacterium]
MTGIVTDIQRFSIHDGPGIRTTVFLKGCNLRCAWCHNPETLRAGPELQLFPGKCIACGACLEACPRGAHVRVEAGREFRRERCVACGACADVCYAEALVLVGREMTVEAVLEEVARDRSYYDNSGGGMTISGGEPLFQRDFCLALLAAARTAGLHTAIETNLAWPWEHVAPVADAADLVMLDVKSADPAVHEQWTGADNELILANARRLSERGAALIVRTPIVPGVNDTPEAVGAIADFAAGLEGLLYYELLPYHPLGTGKYEGLGMDYPLRELKRPDAETMHRLAAEARKRRIEVRAPR